MPVKELIGDHSNHHHHEKEPKGDSHHHHQKLSETAVEIINDSNDTRQSSVDSIAQKVSCVTTVPSGFEARKESEELPSSDSITQKVSTVSSEMDNRVDEPQLISSNNLLKNVDLVTQKVSSIQPLPTQKDSRDIHDSNSNKSSSSTLSFFKCEKCSLYYKSKESFHFHMQSTHSETTLIIDRMCIGSLFHANCDHKKS